MIFFFLAAAAAAASAGLNSTNNGTFPNTGGASPYVISPQDQQQFLAAMAAGQVLPGKKRLRVKIEIDLKSCRPRMVCIY